MGKKGLLNWAVEFWREFRITGWMGWERAAAGSSFLRAISILHCSLQSPDGLFRSSDYVYCMKLQAFLNDKYWVSPKRKYLVKFFNWASFSFPISSSAFM